ncbi:MAG: SDR family oxidoreductase [Candidatus Aenigmarchaeota archaeon]|nr:SDR family oxidoreductase [Candidatus Aenigmarchaeota archaeon]
MKILVTGGSGFVGYYLCKKLISDGHEVVFTYNTHKCDIEGATSIKADLSSSSFSKSVGQSFDSVIHAAALANVDLCEREPRLAYLHNVKATQNVINFARKSNAKFVYISTSFVFSGKKQIYTDNDEPNIDEISNVYGKTKLQGEILVKNSGLDYIILRIDQPYYWNQPWQKENTVTRTLRKLKNNEPIYEVVDWYNCPTFLPSFCELVSKVLKTNIQGAFNAAGPDYINRFEWTKKVAEVFGYEKESIFPINSMTFNLLVTRPNTRLLSSAIYNKANVKHLGIEAALLKMKADYWGKNQTIL